MANVTRVSGLSQEISQANKEQSQGVTEINVAISQMNAVTQQNTAASEKAAHAAVDLSAQAKIMKSSVEELVHLVEGSRGSLKNTGTGLHSGNQKNSNIVEFKSIAKKEKRLAVKSGRLKTAAGDDSTPDRNDESFSEE